MKIRNEYLILGVIIVALSLYLLLRSEGRSNYEMPRLDRIGPNQINRIEVIQKEKSVTLSKSGADWKILPQGFPGRCDQSQGNARHSRGSDPDGTGLRSRNL